MDSTLELIVSLLTAVSVLAVGLEIEFRSIRVLRTKRFQVFGLLAGQMLLVPVLAVMVVSIMPMPERLKLVVLVLSVCPTGSIANFFTLLSHGNLSLSVVASACSCLMAPIFMPGMLSIYGALLNKSLTDMTPPGLLMEKVLLLTWAPLFLGMVLRNLRIKWMTVFSTGLRKVSATSILGLCIFLFATRFGDIASDLRTNAIVSATLIVATILGALGMARLMRATERDAICYVTAFPARHLGLLAALLAALRRIDGLALVLVYFTLECAIMFIGVGAYRWCAARVVRPETSASNGG